MDKLKPLMLDLIRVSIPFKRLIEQFIAPFEKSGFIQVQVIAMFTLKELGPVNMSTLAKSIGYSNQRLTNPIYELVKMGMVERKDDARNRRIVLVELSDAGLKKVDELTDKAVEALKERCIGLENDDINRLCEALKTCDEVMSKMKKN